MMIDGLRGLYHQPSSIIHQPELNDMKTFSAKADDVERQWLVIDAAGSGMKVNCASCGQVLIVPWLNAPARLAETQRILPFQPVTNSK